VIDARVRGSVQAGFEPVEEAFIANFERNGEVGAALCVYLHGKQVVDLAGGVKVPGTTEPYTQDTLQLVWSTTKGITAVAAHMLAQEGRLDFDAPVVKYWPEFGAEGKEDIPVRWLFSHRAGLAAVDRPHARDDLLAWTPVVDALAAQRPLWEPGVAHGYHTFTYGWLAGEVIRRVTGGKVGDFVADRIAGPLGAEFWIGLPASESSRVAPVIPRVPQEPFDPYTLRAMDHSSLAFRSFANPAIAPAAFNEYPLWSADVPAGNGIGTARALARIYAACIGEVDGVRLLQPETLERAIRTQSHGEDLTMGFETRFGTGFQLSYPFRPMGGEGSFGHYGSGGSVGFAHNELGFSFGYVMNRMGPIYGVDPRTKALAEAVLRCL
jgi:CubicO group peptidase (beta-lactamase class C family)